MGSLGKSTTTEPRWVARQRQLRATFSSRLLWPFVAASQQIGTNVQTSLIRVELTEGQLRDPNVRIPFPVAYDLLETLVADSGRSDLGQLAAKAVQRGYFDLFELAIRSAPTLGDATETMIRFSELVVDGAVFTLERGPVFSKMRFVVNCGLPVHPTYVEFIAATVLLFARREANVDSIGCESISFQHAALASAESYEALFQSPIYFNADENVAVFRTELFALPCRRSNPPMEREAIAVIRECVSESNA